MSWQVQYGTETKTRAEWGLKNFVIRKASQRVDQLSFTHIRAAFDADPIFSVGSTIKILKDNAPYFEGVVKQVTFNQDAASQGQLYQVVSGWRWLEENAYQATWAYYLIGVDGGGAETKTLVSGNSTHLKLNLRANGTLATTREVIKSVLQYAIAHGAALQLGTIDLPDAYLPVNEVRDRLCAEVIRDQLRQHPDAVVWLDYSVSPPKVHVRPASALTAVSLAKGVDKIRPLSIAPLHELQRSAVVVRYESTGSVDGREVRTMYVESAPAGATGLEDGALNYTVNLRGITIQNAEAKVTCEPLPQTNAEWVAWFKEKVPFLARPETTNVAVVAGKQVECVAVVDGVKITRDAPKYPNELVKGTLAEWMTIDDEPVESEDEEITIHLKYDFTEGGVQYSGVADKVFTQKITATNAETARYSAVSQFTAAEPRPVGLAAHEFDVFKVLRFGGSLALNEGECSGKVAMGSLLNLTGYQQAAWATMNALVQTITEDLDRGVTTIQFGPPAHLTIPDTLSLLV